VRNGELLRWRGISTLRPGTAQLGLDGAYDDVIEGELVVHAVYESHRLMRQSAPGETRYAPVVEEACARV
jgi:hypothetical protein